MKNILKSLLLFLQAKKRKKNSSSEGHFEGQDIFNAKGVHFVKII